jgi:hypothetical protein
MEKRLPVIVMENDNMGRQEDGARAGEASSQVLEERAALLSPSGKEVWPGKKQNAQKKVRFQEAVLAAEEALGTEKQSPSEDQCLSTEELPRYRQSTPITSSPNKEMQDLVSKEEHSVLAVETRAQRRRREERERQDDEATAASGVLLARTQGNKRRRKKHTGCTTQGSGAPVTTPEGVGERSPPMLPTASGIAASQRSSTGISQVTDPGTSEEPALEITRKEFIEAQEEDQALQLMWQQARRQEEGGAEEDSHYVIIDGMLLKVHCYPAREEDEGGGDQEGFSHLGETGGPEETAIVVPTKLRTQVIKRGHDFAGHFGVKKTRKMVEDHFFWPGMGRDIRDHCKRCQQ